MSTHSLGRSKLESQDIRLLGYSTPEDGQTRTAQQAASSTERPARPGRPSTKRAREERGSDCSPPPVYGAIEAAANDRRVRIIETDSSGTEPDESAEPQGAGSKGAGPPMMVGRGGKARPFKDLGWRLTF